MNYVGGYCVVLDLTGGNLGAWGRCNVEQRGTTWNNVEQRGTTGGGNSERCLEKGKSLGQPWLGNCANCQSRFKG